MNTSAVGASSGPASTAAANAAANPASKDMFLRLLVAQIKSQDPLNPADGMQYVSQLAQFSELEQVIGMRDDLAKIAAAVVPAAASE
jgi:flagellar basal-body rod modification protein FlgD